MTTRNRVLGLVGQAKLGARFGKVAAMLPEARRAAASGNAGGAEKVASYRARERRRIDRLWGRLDPRLLDARLRTQR
jgi:hypothetical protein